MGGLVIEEIRPGVQFIPDAAAAFRRAEAQAQREFGRNIGVNSTYRSRSKQLSMFNAWQAYINGRGPYPGHSKALHPDDPLAFHVAGTALDSDDWRNARIVQILAENGFIRNRLYVPNEDHHFEYIRARDKKYGQSAGAGGIEDDMTPDERKMLTETHSMLLEVRDYLGARGGHNTKTPDTVGHKVTEIRDYLGAGGAKGWKSENTLGHKINALFAKFSKTD